MTDKADKKLDGLAELERQILAARRMRAVKVARDHLQTFTTLSMPHPEHPDDPDYSRYEVRPVHGLLCDELEAVERGEVTRLIVTVGPRIGKSEIISRRMPAWFMGRDPYRQVIVSSYADDLATDHGREVREVMRSALYRQVFPDCELRKGSQSIDRLQTTKGGVAHFVGVGSGLTGKGADLLLIDDPIKNREEANSRVQRDALWLWFTQVAMTRLMGAMGRVVIVMTRWHEDDIVGRLTDPKNPHYNPVEAAKWRVVNLLPWPENEQDAATDPLGREVGELLWPERLTRQFLEGQRRLDPAGFAALYMGRPAPPEGNLFRAADLQTYNSPSELPKNLRIYGASDHAVSLEQDRDPSCMGCVGVDEHDNIWVLPDLVWRQIDAETAADSMLALMREHRPIYWWAEKGHISKSIGPFLRKRMLEEQVYCAVVEKTPAKDKLTRAQAIHGRVTMGKVFFPSFASWWPAAKEELLAFPYGTHDDFVDFLSWIGIGLGEQVAATAPMRRKGKIETGSYQWIIQSSVNRAATEKQDTRYFMT